MISRRAFALLTAAILLFIAVRVEAETPDPVAVVNSIYKSDSNRTMAFGLDPAERHKYFSKSTETLWDKADAKSNPNGDEVGAIDFDLSTNSQGAEVKSYSIVSSKMDGKAATVVVKLALDNWLRHSPDDDIIRYNFILEDGRWMIDDIGSAADGKPWTLLELLEINSHDRTRAKE